MSNDPTALSREEGLFVSGIHAAMVNEPMPRAIWILYLLLAVVGVAIAWSSMATVDEVTRCEARIVPDGHEQVIASLESGTLREVLVHEGDEVQPGQALARMDPTRMAAQQNEGETRSVALHAQAARLTAEAGGKPLVFPPDVLAQATLAAAETEAYEARRRVLDEAVASISRSAGLLSKELHLDQAMASKGLMSDVEVMRMQRQINELNEQRDDRISRFRQEAASELVRVQTEAAQQDQQMVVSDDALKHTVLTSPAHGYVKVIHINTVGGIITPGASIMEIVPIGPRVLIEAHIKPGDIGFIHMGQKVVIKLNGYDFNVNGGLEGKIDYISPDALGEVEKGPDTSYYRASITADANHLLYKGKPLPVIPGMTAVADIRTGERSVMSYLLRPMMKSREALQER